MTVVRHRGFVKAIAVVWAVAFCYSCCPRSKAATWRAASVDPRIASLQAKVARIQRSAHAPDPSAR